MFRFDTPTARVRSIAFFEGVSYVILLFGAVPLKYVAGEPLAVRIVGPIHGALFLWLVILLAQGFYARGQPLGWALRIGIASLVPFGTLVLDRRLRAEDEAFRSDPAASREWRR